MFFVNSNVNSTSVTVILQQWDLSCWYLELTSCCVYNCKGSLPLTQIRILISVPQRSWTRNSARTMSSPTVVIWCRVPGRISTRTNTSATPTSQPSLTASTPPQVIFNPLECKDNYSTTSNNMKLVHWPLMGGLIHLVQRGGAWAGAGCGPAQSLPRCTKWTVHPSTASVPTS